MAAKTMAEVYDGEVRTGTYQEYIDQNPSRRVLKPILHPTDSDFMTNSVESIVMEDDLIIYQGMFQVPSDFHFWVPEKEERVDQPSGVHYDELQLEGYWSSLPYTP